MEDLTNKLAFSLLLIILITTLITSLAFMNFSMNYTGSDASSGSTSGKMSITIKESSNINLEKKEVEASNSNARVGITIQE